MLAGLLATQEQAGATLGIDTQRSRQMNEWVIANTTGARSRNVH